VPIIDRARRADAPKSGPKAPLNTACRAPAGHSACVLFNETQNREAEHSRQNTQNNKADLPWLDICFCLHTIGSFVETLDAPTKQLSQPPLERYP
jgi:hypothetical protein